MKPQLKEIDISLINVSEANVRKMAISNGELSELVASIKEKGVLQPVIVVRKGNRYELPVGQNRFLAAKEAGLKTIPAMVYDELSPSDMRVISAIENLQRINLSEADRAGAVYDLVREYGGNSSAIKAVAKKLGYSEGWVRKELGFRGLPDEVKKMVNEEKLTTSEASALRPMLKWKPLSEIVEVAKTISEMPKDDTHSKEIRKTAVSLARRTPTISAEELKQRAEKKTLLTLQLSISDTEMNALKRAAEKEDEEPEELAHRVINEWLISNDYLPKP